VDNPCCCPIPCCLETALPYPAGAFVLKGCYLLLRRQPLSVEKEPLPKRGAAPVLKSAATCGEVSLAVSVCAHGRPVAASSYPLFTVSVTIYSLGLGFSCWGFGFHSY
jgi:hypothetical protein